MKETFDFHVRAAIPHLERAVEVHVVVKGTTIALYGVKSRLCAGIWDSGGYVRYADSGKLDVHPSVLDEVDLQLRKRMTVSDVFRVHPPRRSAVGYQG